MAAKRGFVEAIHRGEVAKIGEKNGRFGDILKTCVNCGKEGADIGDDLLRLRLDAAFDDFHGRRIKRDLPGAEEEIANACGVGVGTDGSGSFRRIDESHGDERITKVANGEWFPQWKADKLPQSQSLLESELSR